MSEKETQTTVDQITNGCMWLLFAAIAVFMMAIVLAVSAGAAWWLFSVFVGAGS